MFKAIRVTTLNAIPKLGIEFWVQCLHAIGEPDRYLFPLFIAVRDTARVHTTEILMVVDDSTRRKEQELDDIRI
ncbi:hypothetical protein D2E33_21015 [Mycobacteroides abscessus]|nr:hypothetical protein D2E33_21015 [Mycobacteroides abscessus]RIT45761.1 hypothetical protein D2E80_15770 [Mycobacteroides abscessus]RIT65542.1 hypothetical protein D2E87_16460 [Mycobacteroides abscessus]